MGKIDKQISERIRSKRLLQGLTQKELADELGVSVRQIQKYENSINRISSGKLFILSKLLSVPLEYFFVDLEEEIDLEATLSENFLSNHEKELIMLIKAYSKIKDPEIRSNIVDFIKAISENYEGPDDSP